MIEELIPYIFTKNFVALEKCAYVVNDDYSNLIHYIIYSAVRTLFIITDRELYKILYIILTKNYNIYIQEIGVLLIKLVYNNNNKYTNCHKFLNIYAQYQTNKIKLDDIVCHLNSNMKSNRCLITNVPEKITVDNISLYSRMLKDVLRSFVDMQFLQILKLKNKSSSSKVWEDINTEEIINRLDQLKKIFGLKFIKSLNIKILTVNDFIEYTYDDKIKYYLICIECINTYLDLAQATFNSYSKLKDTLDDCNSYIGSNSKNDDNMFIYILDKSVEAIPKYTTSVDNTINLIVDELFASERKELVTLGSLHSL